MQFVKFIEHDISIYIELQFLFAKFFVHRSSQTRDAATQTSKMETQRIMSPKQIATIVANMLKRHELRLTRGHTGRYYLMYFDSTKCEPFRAVILPTDN
jgi:hypothetical protein